MKAAQTKYRNKIKEQKPNLLSDQRWIRRQVHPETAKKEAEKKREKRREDRLMIMRKRKEEASKLIRLQAKEKLMKKKILRCFK